MNYEIVPLDKPLVEPAFTLATEVFIQGSTLHRALGIGLEEYRNYLRPSFSAMVAEALSFCAVGCESRELIGCLIATDFSASIDAPVVASGEFAALSALTRELSRSYHEHRAVNAGEVMLMDMGVVSPRAIGTGVYQKMRATAQARGRERGFRWVVGELSSAATQHVVLNKLNHRKVAEVMFSDFEFGGAVPFRSIESPRSIVLAEGDL